MPTPAPNKVIYSMVGVSKFYDKKQVLKDIYLSYFYGAKIGVIGLNGSGKSSLLRILAGTDKDHLGETILSPGHTIGMLEQEPRLDETKTVREIVEEGIQPIFEGRRHPHVERFSRHVASNTISLHLCVIDDISGSF